MFDFMKASMTEVSFEQYATVYNEFAQHDLSFVATPHAPYTVSPGLFWKNQSTESTSLYHKHPQSGDGV